jgi:hypothetical protein
MENFTDIAVVIEADEPSPSSVQGPIALYSATPSHEVTSAV